MFKSIFRDPKSKYRLLLAVAAIVIVIVLFWGKGEKSVSIAFQEYGITLSAPEEDGFSVNVAYADITAIELLQELDFGQCVHGTDTEHRKNGAWENALLGSYRLCIYTEIPQYIVLYAGSCAVVFNYESEATTQKLYEALCGRIVP